MMPPITAESTRSSIMYGSLYCCLNLYHASSAATTKPMARKAPYEYIVRLPMRNNARCNYPSPPDFSPSFTSLPVTSRTMTTIRIITVSYTHLRAHETRHDLVCRLLLEQKN